MEDNTFITNMRHKKCGGELYEDDDKIYEHEGAEVPSLWCRKCKKEITGDKQIVFEQ